MQIQDFGEKIGGARKDLFNPSGLIVDNVDFMNEAEKKKYIVKNNIWKKPNYSKLIESGLDRRVVFFMKFIRDLLPSKPSINKYCAEIENDNIQKKYINDMIFIKNKVDEIKTEEDIINFNSNIYFNGKMYFNTFHRKLEQNIRDISIEKIDREIAKKQFEYTQEEKLLADYKILLYDNKNIKFDTMYDRKVLVYRELYSSTFIYPKEEWLEKESWKENSYFILKNGSIIKNNIKDVETAKKYIIDNLKTTSNEKKINRKSKFRSEQLQNVIRTGENYRKDKDITGQDMIKTFGFKGGEFGNWLNENERQEALNFGYDALLDLSKALSISAENISLNGKLSLAFGSRGRSSAVAHYEPDREVINLTKMNGAGSLAHEWAHALDDIIAKELNIEGFITENLWKENLIREEFKEVMDTIKFKIVKNRDTNKLQEDKYYKEVNKLKNLVNSLFPSEHLSASDSKYKDELLQKIVNYNEKIHNDFMEYYNDPQKNVIVELLSKLRKQTVGNAISKYDKLTILHYQKYVYDAQVKIGKEETITTDFFKGSQKFDELHSKTTNGYWQSNTELFARAFACYIKDKLNCKSDYLCGHADLSETKTIDKNGEIEIIKAYPTGEEREVINEKIDKLITALKEKNIFKDISLNKEKEEIYDYGY